MMGFIPNWFPTLGLGPILSVGFAKMAKVNVFPAVIGGIIGTPLWPVLFWFNYRVGGLFQNQSSEVDQIEQVEYIEVVNDTVGSIQSGSLQFLAGACINILISSMLLYVLVYMLFRKYRSKQQDDSSLPN
jgi:uncharacterized protein